ncbi:MAG: hypothetical protein WAU92_07615 [Candidatus Sulfotelmatobacter sp.]
MSSPSTQLDEFVPVYQFREYHSTRVQAPAERVYRGVKLVTADDIFLFRTLAWIRRFGRSGPNSILNPPRDKPILDVATEASFLLLADRPNREIVVGTVVIAPRGWKLDERPTPEEFNVLQHPGFALAAMNFFIHDAGPGTCALSTETRVYATDAKARWRFGAYWWLIYPGSALIRRMWLRAIGRRARRN